MMTKNLQRNIPIGWKLKKLSDILDYERPDNYIVKSTSYNDTAKTPVLTANKSFVLGYTNEDFGIYKHLPAIIFDDFTTDSKFVDFPFKVKSSAIKILKEKNKDIDLRFVFERMKLINFPTGSHKRFYISQYQNLEIGLPPIKEQQKIAEILGTVDEEIKKTQGVIEATEKLKRGLMQQLFTRGIGHAKFKETKIGKIPEEWKVLQIKNAPLQIADGNYSAKYPRQNEFIEGGVPFVRVNNLQNQTLVKDDLKYISAEKHAALKKGHLKTNDVLITTRGKLGVIALVPSEFDDANINAQIVLLRADDKELLPKFLMYFLLSPKFQSQVFTGGSGSALQQLPVGILENTFIPMPDAGEQKEIVDILSSIDGKILVNKKLREKLILLKKGLMHDLLSGKVRTNYNE